MPRIRDCSTERKVDMETAIVRQRIHILDTLKGILILLVVIGHLLEVIPGFGLSHPLYKIIYSFHMPAFIFISGFFIKPSLKKLIRLLILFIATQLVYQIFVHLVYQKLPITDFRITFQQPYWILWYLVVMIYYTCLSPILNLTKGSGEWITFGASVLFALVVGYISEIGYPLSLSRFFVFLPFFIAGFYAKRHKEKIFTSFSKLTRKQKAFIFAGNALLLVPAVLFVVCGPVTAQMLYGSYSYKIGYNAALRLLFMIIGGIWTFFLLAIVTFPGNRKIPVLSFVGKHTMPIYLLHGFLIKLIAWGII